MVVSGINHGPNLGADVHYSGTVAAAREGLARGTGQQADTSQLQKRLEEARAGFDKALKEAVVS